MKAIGIVGFKNSGKTTLTAKLADALEARGKRVAIAKFTHHGLDKQGTDTATFARPGRTVIGLGPEETAIFWGEQRYLVDLLPLAQADILLVEGGKHLTWLPRILCLKSASEAEELDNGLALATFGDVAAPYLKSYRDDTLDKLAALAEERAFRLPGLDCEACDAGSCLGVAQNIVKGKGTVRDCRSMNTDTMSITVNGSPIALNPFVERIIYSAITGMLGELKGYMPGDVSITLKG